MKTPVMCIYRKRQCRGSRVAWLTVMHHMMMSKKDLDRHLEGEDRQENQYQNTESWLRNQELTSILQITGELNYLQQGGSTWVTHSIITMASVKWKPIGERPIATQTRALDLLLSWDQCNLVYQQLACCLYLQSDFSALSCGCSCNTRVTLNNYTLHVLELSESLQNYVYKFELQPHCLNGYIMEWTQHLITHAYQERQKLKQFLCEHQFGHKKQASCMTNQCFGSPCISSWSGYSTAQTSLGSTSLSGDSSACHSTLWLLLSRA